MNTQLVKSKYKQGLSLPELMIAMLIGLIVVIGTTSVYLASKQSNREMEIMAKLAQKSRHALEIISSPLLHAGFMGELPATSIIKDTRLGPIAGTDCLGSAAVYDVEHYLYAEISNTNGQALGCINDAVAGTSVLVIKNVRPVKLIDSDADGIIDYPQSINAKQTYLMAHHSKGILFDGTDTAPSILEAGEVPGGSGWIYGIAIFYIRDIGNSIPQLSRKVLAWNGSKMALTTEDLVSGIENMSFSFAVDSNANGEIDTYKATSAMNNLNWLQTSAVKVNILVKSDTPDQSYTNLKTYTLTGLKTYGPTKDKYHRKLVETSVSLRNPKLVTRSIW